MGYASLQEVKTGWTGAITITFGAASITVTPGVRESVASIWAQVQYRALAEMALTLTAGVIASDQYRVSSNSVFGMSFSAGNIASRMDFDSGPYSGTSSYDSDANAGATQIVPSGLRVDDLMVGTRGRAVSDGSSAAALVPAGDKARIRMTMPLASAIDLEAVMSAFTPSQLEHDVFYDGRVLARVRIAGSPMRRAQTRTHGATTSPVELSLPVVGVRNDYAYQTPAQYPSQRAQYHIYSYVRTDVPGYRDIQIGSALCRLASGTYRFDEFVDVVDSAIGAFGFCTLAGAGATPGRVTIDLNVSAALGFPDRLGWLLGFGTEAGVTLSVGTTFASPFIPPGGFPLIGADWEEVELDRDLHANLDVLRRGSGYGWGGVRVWQVTATMTRWAVEAFLAGWVQRGRIAIVPAAYPSTAMSSAQPSGYLDGYVIQVQRQRWLDAVEQFAELTFLLATSPL